MMNYNAFLKFMRTRRTIRAVEPDPIPGGVVAKLTRDKEAMSHFDKAGPDEFFSEDKVREQIIKFRAGNVGHHKAAVIERGGE